MRVKMSKQSPPAHTASAVGPCPTVIQIVGRPGTGSLPSTIAPPDHPLVRRRNGHTFRGSSYANFISLPLSIILHVQILSFYLFFVIIFFKKDPTLKLAMSSGDAPEKQVDCHLNGEKKTLGTLGFLHTP